MNQCTVPDCTKQILVKSRGLCDKHNYRFLTNGNVNVVKQVKDGRSKLSEYHIWLSMRARCYNPNNEAYARYGGRGITMCERWRKDFLLFLADMGRRPSARHSVERRDNNEGYSPENCYWATNHEQGSNKRNNTLDVGVNWDKNRNKWAAVLHVNNKTVLNKRFKTYAEALAARKQAERDYL